MLFLSKLLLALSTYTLLRLVAARVG